MAVACLFPLDEGRLCSSEVHCANFYLHGYAQTFLPVIKVINYVSIYYICILKKLLKASPIKTNSNKSSSLYYFSKNKKEYSWKKLKRFCFGSLEPCNFVLFRYFESEPISFRCICASGNLRKFYIEYISRENYLRNLTEVLKWGKILCMWSWNKLGSLLLLHF